MYQSGESNCLLELAQEKIPISGNDWDDMAWYNHSWYPEKERTRDLFQCKFYSFAKTMARTGDPTIPSAAAKAKIIYWDIIQETDGLTGSAYLLAELDMSNEDQLKSETNDQEDKVAEPSGVIVDFFQLAEGVTANANKGIELTKYDGSKKVRTNSVGKLLAASTACVDGHLCTIASWPSSISNSSGKLEKTGH